jgi:DNA-directed RNA polymerase subunit RPC12/RpoP
MSNECTQSCLHCDREFYVSEEEVENEVLFVCSKCWKKEGYK